MGEDLFYTRMNFASRQLVSGVGDDLQNLHSLRRQFLTTLPKGFKALFQR